MASNHRLKLWIVNSQTRKIYDRKMFKQMPVMGMHKELLPMACLRQNWQEALTESQIIGKKQGP